MGVVSKAVIPCAQGRRRIEMDMAIDLGMDVQKAVLMGIVMALRDGPKHPLQDGTSPMNLNDAVEYLVSEVVGYLDDSNYHRVNKNCEMEFDTTRYYADVMNMIKVYQDVVWAIK